jgi:DNA-binding MarR family transcriptional regulator
MTGTPKGRPSSTSSRRASGEARELAVTLFDLAWLLPRTIGAEERQADPLPRSELEVMRLLGRRPGTGVNMVARELGLQPSNVSASIRSLVAKGLVERRTSPDDRRHALLYLTAGARVARQAREQVWGRQLRDLLRRLTSEQEAAILGAAPALAALAQELAELS